MCGIAGFIDYAARGDDELHSVAEDMIGSIRHRGPDARGVWLDRLGEESTLVLGHRRLSILDLSELGRQPMISESGRFVVTFNGEIYNFRALRTELARLGHEFRGGSDTEVLLAAVEEWGVRAALDRFVGMFAFGLWDAQRRLLYLVRDRLGIKPLYHGWLGSTYAFASELTALASHPDFEPSIHRGALGLYFHFLCVPAPYSIQTGVGKIEPGTFTVIRPDDRTERTESYWDLGGVFRQGARHPFDGSEDEALERLDRLVGEAVEGRLESDVPLGALFSGGIDSTAVVAAMAARLGRDLRTFTIGFDDPRHDESRAAARIASHLGTEHTELRTTNREAMETVPALAGIYDEPFADSSQVPTCLVSRLARRHVTVALSGDGGDEQFAGYDRYDFGGSKWSMIGRAPRPVRRAAGRTLRAIPLSAWDSALGAARALRTPAGQELTGQSIHTLGHLLATEDAVDLWREIVSIWRDPSALTGEPLPAGRWDRSPETGRSSSIREMMLSDGTLYLPDDVLTKVDRASMSVGLEVRVPLLDHRVVEFTASLPMRFLRQGGVRKLLLRRLVYRRVPPELVDRPKQGFSVPLADWLRGPLRDWAEPFLTKQALESSDLDSRLVTRLWKQHVAGSRNWEHQLWSVVMFQAWKDRSRQGGST